MIAYTKTRMLQTRVKVQRALPATPDRPADDPASP